MRRSLLVAVLAALVLQTVLQAAQADDAPAAFVPNFWNPDALPPKPDLGRIGAIRFITTNDYPPFGFTLADGTAAGFDVDLARALCDELKVPCTVQARSWDRIVPAITGGQGDAAIASLAITEAARQKVAFTAPYYKTPARFVVRFPSPLAGIEPDAVAGKRIGVEAKSAHQAFLAVFFPKATAVPFETMDSARAALRSGAVDAVFGDATTWALWLNGQDAGGCCGFLGGPYTESRFFGQGAGIAVRKTDGDLREALDYALALVAAKGVYGEIYLRYFPVGPF